MGNKKIAEVSCADCRYLLTETYAEPCAQCSGQNFVASGYAAVENNEDPPAGVTCHQCSRKNSRLTNPICRRCETTNWSHFTRGTMPTTTKLTNPKDAIGCDKAPMSTVPAGVMAEVGLALLEGAAKYGRYNYRAMGVRSTIYYDATMRHLIAWFEGEDIDPDSGLSHITKAIASLVVLRDAMRNGKVTDDRPPISPVGYPELNKQAADIISRHADKNPHHFTKSDTGS